MPRQELLEFIGAKLGVDRDVAEEHLSGLEVAGFPSFVYASEVLKVPEAFARGL